MKSAAAQSGGYFTQINPTEPIAWRALDLLATLNTPRLAEIKVSSRVGPDRVASAGPPNGGPALASSDTQAVGPVHGELVPPYNFLTCEDSLAQGEQLCAIARLDAAAEMPKTIEITGQLDGKPQKWTLPVDGVAQQADYLPRTWAKLEIDRLVADGAEKNKARDHRTQQGDVRHVALHVAPGPGERGDVRPVPCGPRAEGPLGHVRLPAADSGGF